MDWTRCMDSIPLWFLYQRSALWISASNLASPKFLCLGTLPTALSTLVSFLVDKPIKTLKKVNKSQFTSSVGYENVITNHDIVDNKTLIISNANKAPNSITRTFKGNRKRFELSGVRVIGISNKTAESKVKNSFYCTVNIFITFNCRNVKWKLKDTSRL